LSRFSQSSFALLITQDLKPAELPAAGSLYHLFVISRRFEGLPKIDRHRIVYEYLKPFIGHGIHNINMILLAPSESRH